MDNNLFLLGPIFFPFAGVITSLLLVRNNVAQRYIGLAAAVAAWISSLIVLYQRITTDQIQVYHMGGWQPPYGIVLVGDMLGALFIVMASTVVVCVVLYVVSCHDKCMTYPAFMPVLLAMITGLHGTFYTGDLFTLFVFTELMVTSSVVLVAISDNPYGLEAAIKYLLISAMGTLFLLLGIAAIYATFGTLNMADIARLLASGERPILAQAAALMLMCAFLLKSAVFPFHFWQPDFHTTAPTPLSALLSSVVVKVGVYGLIRITTLLFAIEAPLIQNTLVFLGLIGVFLGGFSAMRTYDAKRMLAYSTFSQVGFILVGIGWGNPIALAGAIIFAVNHAFIKSAMLMLTGLVASYTRAKTARLRDLSGAGYGMKRINAMYFLGALALAGLPPMNGFISKLSLVEGGVETEQWLVYGLVIGGSILTLIYTMRAWQLIFQREPSEETAELKDYGDSPFAPAILITLCLLLGLYAAPLVTLATQVVTQLQAPQVYINAVLGSF
jgi:multicomponent Na+:H+ antiporter subunit D